MWRYSVENNFKCAIFSVSYGETHRPKNGNKPEKYTMCYYIVFFFTVLARLLGSMACASLVIVD